MLLTQNYLNGTYSTDEEYFSENASSVLHELTAGKLLDGQVITREGSIPYIHLYQISTRGVSTQNTFLKNNIASFHFILTLLLQCCQIANTSKGAIKFNNISLVHKLYLHCSVYL